MAGLNRIQWVQWAVATAIAGLVMVVSILTYANTIVFPKDRGELMESDFRNHVDKVEQRLISIDNKLDDLKDLVYQRELLRAKQ